MVTTKRMDHHNSGLFGKVFFSYVREGKVAQTKLFGPDIFSWDGDRPREGVGGKKCGMSFETHGNQNFRRDIPAFCRDMSGAPEKFENNSLCLSLVPNTYHPPRGNHNHFIFCVFGGGVKSGRGAIAILAAATALEICLERPFTRTIANEPLHSKQQTERTSLLTTVNYCGA